MWQYFLTAIALVLVLEGIMPFLSPQRWRTMMFHVIKQKDSVLRIIGIVSMLLGVLILYLVHTGLLFD